MRPIEELIPDTEKYIKAIEERIKTHSINDLCDLTDKCYYDVRTPCVTCKYASDFSWEEYDRITKNSTKIPTIKEIREAYIKITLLG